MLLYLLESSPRPAFFPLLGGTLDLLRGHIPIAFKLFARSLLAFRAGFDFLLLVAERNTGFAVHRHFPVTPFKRALGWIVIAARAGKLQPFSGGYFETVAAVPKSVISGRGMSGKSQGQQQAGGNQGFHGAPFCFGSNVRTTFRQYNLG